MASHAVRAFQSGESLEAGRLYKEHSEWLYRYCQRQLGTTPDAEDAVQTTFVYALRALRRGVVPKCESAWLTAIAKNVCRWQRRTLDRRGPLASDVDLDRVALARPDGDEAEILSGLREALASLPERQRHALVLREWRGLSSREIASRLEMTPSATYALLTRARKSLSQALTAPRRTVLGLGTLLYEVRSQFKALLGGGGAKAATATLLVGAVAGGVTVESALRDERSVPRAPGPVVAGTRVDAAMLGVASREKRKVVSKDTPTQRRAPIPTGVQPAVLGPEAPYVARPLLPPARLPGGDSAPGPAADPAAPARPDREPAPALPVELPQVPEVEPLATLVPSDLLPPIPALPQLPNADPPSVPSPDLGLPPLP